MHEYSSVSSSASDITMVSFSNRNLSISSSSEDEDVAPSSATTCPKGTCWSGWRPKEYPTGWDDQLVEDRVELKNQAETRLYKPNDSRFP